MLTREEVRAHLERVTYRPGWTITLHEHPFEGPVVRFVGPVEDSYNPGSSIDLGVDSFLPPMPDTGALEAFLAWRLARLESHEAREWLKVDGRLPFDPHAS